MKEKMLSISFVTLLFFFLLLGLVIKDKEISIMERRNLTTKEDLKKDTFENLESYLTDQFPFRNGFLSLYPLIDRVLFGNKENNDIYIKEGYLIEKNYPLNEKSIEEFSKKINSIVNKYMKNNHILYAIIPDKSYFLEKERYQKLDFSKMFDKLEKEITIPNLNITSFLKLEDFFKTDIHLKQEAYEKIVKELAKYFDFSLLDIYWNKQSYNSFYGTTYAKNSLLSKKEELNYYTNNWTENAKVWHLEYGEKKVYDIEKLGNIDSYSLFLSGPSSLIEITNSQATTNKELLLFRDSFGSSLAPLLLPYYHKITLIDLRYINMDQVLKYVTFDKQDVLFLYSTLLVNQSNLLKENIQ